MESTNKYLNLNNNVIHIENSTLETIHVVLCHIILSSVNCQCVVCSFNVY